MATKSSIQVRIEPQLKEEAESVLENIGLDTPTAIRIFYRKIVSTRSIPFSLEENPYHFTSEEEDEILEAVEASKNPENIVATTSTKEETRAFLDSLT